MDALNPLLTTCFAAAVLIDLAAPFILAVFLARRFGCRWRYWWYGVLVFLLFQGVTRVPLMLLLQSLPGFQAALKTTWISWTFLFVAAFTAGLFEEGGRWLAFRYVIAPRERSWKTAMMLGAGHGGLECALMGLVVLAALVGYVVITIGPPESIPGNESVLSEARLQFSQLQGWEPLLGAWERLAVLPIQMAFTVMVLQAFLRGARWWWYALAAHTLVDFTSVAVLWIVGKFGTQQAALLATEAYVGLLAVASLWFLVRMRNDPLNNAELPEPDPAEDPASYTTAT